MEDKKVTPAVIFSLGFCYNWHIGGRDFYDYMRRPGAFDAERHKNDVEYNSTYDYFEYMKNTEKSDGAFDAENDILTDELLDRKRVIEEHSRDDGAPKYFGVVSFDNEFLKEQGLIAEGALDAHRLRELARTGMANMIHASNKLNDDNVIWTAAIHTNTDNIHIHFSICEKECRHRKKDMLEIKAFDKLKSSIVNGIIGSERTVELTKLQRQTLLPLFQRTAGATKEQLTNLAAILPSNKSWQYNQSYMKEYRQMIDCCCENIINSSDELKNVYAEYMKKLDEQTERLRSLYGDGNRHLYLSYKKNRLSDLQSRMGNSLLKSIASSDLPKLIEEQSSIPFPNAPPDAEDYAPLSTEISSLGQDILSIQEEIDKFNLDMHSSDYELTYQKLGVHPSEERTLGFYWSAEYKTALKAMYSKDKDLDTAERLLKYEASTGNVLADLKLGKLYDIIGTGNSSEYYYSQAFEKLSKLKNSTDNRTREYSYAQLGKLYQYGLGTEQSYENAISCYKAAPHNAAAHYALGTLFERGLGCDKSEVGAFNHYLEAYNISSKNSLNPYAAYAVGRCYENGTGVAKDEEAAQIYYAESFNIFKSLDDKDESDDNILYRLGYMNYLGKGTVQSTKNAIEYLDRAANSKNVNAMLMLGRIYLSDEARDFNKAIEYLSKAAEKDNTQAAYLLGKTLIDNGDKSGLEWLHLAADYQGNSNAQAKLGFIYLSKQYRDMEKAKKYLQLAASNGNEYADNALKCINNQHRSSSATYVINPVQRSANRHELERTLYSASRVLAEQKRIIARTTNEALEHCRRLIDEFNAEEQYRIEQAAASRVI